MVLLLLILSSTGREALEILAFNIHQEEITRRLCINLNKPEKKCNGKCALKARLEKQQEQKQSPASPLPEPGSKAIYTLDVLFFDHLGEQKQVVSRIDTWLALTSRLIVAELAHPPELLV